MLAAIFFFIARREKNGHRRAIAILGCVEIFRQGGVTRRTPARKPCAIRKLR
jgi:hypothetical protein